MNALQSFIVPPTVGPFENVFVTRITDYRSVIHFSYLYTGFMVTHRTPQSRTQKELQPWMCTVFVYANLVIALEKPLDIYQKPSDNYQEIATILGNFYCAVYFVTHEEYWLHILISILSVFATAGSA